MQRSFVRSLTARPFCLGRDELSAFHGLDRRLDLLADTADWSQDIRTTRHRLFEQRLASAPDADGRRVQTLPAAGLAGPADSDSAKFDQKATCVLIANASNLAPVSTGLVGLICFATLPWR